MLRIRYLFLGLIDWTQRKTGRVLTALGHRSSHQATSATSVLDKRHLFGSIAQPPRH